MSLDDDADADDLAIGQATAAVSSFQRSAAAPGAKAVTAAAGQGQYDDSGDFGDMGADISDGAELDSMGSDELAEMMTSPGGTSGPAKAPAAVLATAAASTAPAKPAPAAAAEAAAPSWLSSLTPGAVGSLGAGSRAAAGKLAPLGSLAPLSAGSSPAAALARTAGGITGPASAARVAAAAGDDFASEGEEEEALEVGSEHMSDFSEGSIEWP
jgi:hypothetical protein